MKDIFYISNLYYDIEDKELIQMVNCFSQFPTFINYTDLPKGEIFITDKIIENFEEENFYILILNEDKISKISYNKFNTNVFLLKRNNPELLPSLRNLVIHLNRVKNQERNINFLKEQLEMILNISIEISSERDVNKLLHKILKTTREITNSDAGSIYVVEENEHGEKYLRFKATQNDSIKVDFSEFTISINDKSVAGYVAHKKQILNIRDTFNLIPELPFKINRDFDNKSGYCTKNMLVAPLTDQNNNIVGVLQLINRKRTNSSEKITSKEIADKNIIPYDKSAEKLIASIASFSGIILENSRLYQNIENLFKGFVKASVKAIESRDPTTSGHSDRVAKLSLAIAKEINNINEGYFANYYFTPENLKELEYACLLHDFGKVGVREHILTKANKLFPHELSEIEYKIELIKKSMQISFYKNLENISLEEKKVREEELNENLKKLDYYKQVIRTANEPNLLESSYANVLDEIHKFSYKDEITGEEIRLLDDRLLNILKIKRGSLSDEEREEIESHVLHSYHFLLQIPWSKDLQNIPKIVVSHHEKLNGFGYPFKLSSDEIPFQSQIIAVADIFDALTASDRPYKKAVSPEVALKIMAEAFGPNQININIFNLLKEKKLYNKLIEIDQNEKNKIKNIIKNIPKIEFHLHLCGTMKPSTLEFLMKKYNSNLDYTAPEKYEFENLEDFINQYLNNIDSVKCEEDLNYLLNDLVEYLENENIIYAEVFWAPSKFIMNGLDFKKMVNIIKEKIIKVRNEKGIIIKILVDISRTFGIKNSENLINKFLEVADDIFIGIGLGGDEAKTPTKDYEDLFKKVQQKNLYTVAHAGEGHNNFKNIWEAVDTLNAKRIGHGIAAINDKDLMKHLADKKIPLEICITSNKKIKFYENINEHPIQKFIDNGINVTIHTDDPLLYNTTLTEEYSLLLDYFNYSLNDILNLMYNSYIYAFMNEEEREIYKNKFNKFLNDKEIDYRLV